MTVKRITLYIIFEDIDPCLVKKKSRQYDEECRVLIVALRKQMFRSDGCPVLLPSLIASISLEVF